MASGGLAELADRLLPSSSSAHHDPSPAASSFTKQNMGDRGPLSPTSFPSSSHSESPVAALSELARHYVDLRRSRGDHSPLLVPVEAQLVRGFARELHSGSGTGARVELLSSWLLLSISDPTTVKQLVSQVGSLSRLVTLSDGALRGLAERLNVDPAASRRLRSATQRLAHHLAAWKETGHEPPVSDESLAWSCFSTSGATSPATASPRGFATAHAANVAAARQQALSSPSSLDQPSPTTGGGLRKALQVGRAMDRGGRVAALHLPSSSMDSSELPRSSSHDAQLSNVGQHHHNIPPGPASARLDPTTTYNFPPTGKNNVGPRSARDAFVNVRAQTLSPTISPTPVRNHEATGPGPPYNNLGTPRLPNSASAQFGTLPKSPKSNRLMHQIPHQWVSRRNTFRLNDKTCIVCTRPLGFLNQCEKCKSCKLRVHSACKARVNDSCGLTPQHLKFVLLDLLKNQTSQGWSDPAAGIGGSRSMTEMQSAFQYPDSAVVDSSSSTNSSAPSTPAVIGQVTAPASSPYVGPSKQTRFPFPDAVPEVVLTDTNEDSDARGRAETGGSTSTAASATTTSGGETAESVELTATVTSTATSVGSGTLVDSEHTILVDSQGSAMPSPPSPSEPRVKSFLDFEDTLDFRSSSDRTRSLPEKTEHSVDAPGGAGSGGGPSHKWDRNAWNMFTIRAPSASSNWAEVTIPFSKIEFGDSPLIGRGRFGEVLRGQYFGDVAVKLMNMDHIEGDEQRLEEFKHEVQAFKSIRHDNLVLFLGYVFEPQRFGVVTNVCKGKPLNVIIHEAAEPIESTLAVTIATQICQGVSYLHTRRFLHKDLRSRNIFIEPKNKVVITDSGLFSIQRLQLPCLSSGFLVAEHWLCYLAPELIRSLAVDLRELPFSEHSDVFAFGTIWYEMMMSQYPFARLAWDQIMFRAGWGLHGSLHNICPMREIRLKELLMRCWSFSAAERPTFAEIIATLDRLPKRKIARSPSFPVTRSHESMF